MVPETDSTPSLAIGGVLGAITHLITFAGTALLGVFGVLHLVRAVAAYPTGGTNALAGWGAARILTSVGLLMPVGEQGYNVAQAAVVAAAQLGIGMANMAWDLAAEPLVSIASSESAATRQPREVLAIDAEETAAAACDRLASDSRRDRCRPPRTPPPGGATGGCTRAAAAASRTRARRPKSGRLCESLRAPPASGLKRRTGRIHAERVAVLSDLRAGVSDATVDPNTFFFGSTIEAEPLLAWVQGSPPTPLRLDGVEEHYVGHGLVQGYRTPAETQAAWWLLASLIGERQAGACLREWTGTDSAGEPVWRQLRTAIRFDDWERIRSCVRTLATGGRSNGYAQACRRGRDAMRTGSIQSLLASGECATRTQRCRRLRGPCAADPRSLRRTAAPVNRRRGGWRNGRGPAWLALSRRGLLAPAAGAGCQQDPARAGDARSGRAGCGYRRLRR